MRLLDEATDFLSKLIANSTENTDTLTKDVSKNILLGLGNILKISSEDASILLGQTKNFKKKVLLIPKGYLMLLGPVKLIVMG